MIKKNYLIRNSSIITIFKTGTVFTGLILDVAILAIFGLSFRTDAFFAALTVPRLFSALVEMKSPTILVPFFLNKISEEGQTAANVLAGKFIGNCIIIFFVISLLGGVLSRVIMGAQLPGAEEHMRHLSANLSIMLMWIIFLKGTAGILKNFLIMNHEYFWASCSRMIGNIGIIIIFLGLHKRFGIYSIAIAFLVGSYIELIIVVLGLKVRKTNIRLGATIVNKEIFAIYKLAIYPSLDHSLSELREIIENIIASYVGGGSITVIKYCRRIIAAISGVMIGSVITTSLPLISHYTSRTEFEIMKAQLLKAIKIMVYLSVPVCLFLLFLNFPFIRIVFERGEFSQKDASILGMMVMWMVPYLLFSRLAGIHQIPFYASIEMRTPLLGTCLSLVIYILCIMSLLNFSGIYSFSISMSISSICNSALMIFLFTKRFGKIDVASLKGFIGKMLKLIVLTSAVMWIAKVVVNNYIILDYDLANTLIQLIGPASFGGCIFILYSFKSQMLSTKKIMAVIKNE